MKTYNTHNEKKRKTVKVYLSKEQKDWLSELSETEQKSVSALVGSMIETEFERIIKLDLKFDEGE